jgi:hypothetical protein
MEAADLETLAASLAKPLPSEPSLWVRRPPSWRQWSFGALGWFAACVVLIAAQGASGGGSQREFLWSAAAIGAIWILTSVPGGLVDRWRAARLDAARRRDPDRPWLWDHRWDPRGVSGQPWRRLIRATPRSRGLLLYVLAMAFVGPPPATVLWIWGSIGGIAATWIAWRAWRIWGVGTAHVSFTKFPFHPGERVTLHFGMSEGGAQFERASFCLRRVLEPRSRAVPAHSAPWRLGLRENRPPGELPGGNQFVTLEFDVPANAFGTHLSAPRPEYWALDVLANTSAGPYVESFLIPIYERPSPSAAA